MSRKINLTWFNFIYIYIYIYRYFELMDWFVDDLGILVIYFSIDMAWELGFFIHVSEDTENW